MLQGGLADRHYQPGHERIHALMQHIRVQRPRFRVRVAGSNGKGSTSMMLAAALRAAGLTVGLYSSPHVHDFSERVQINGQPDQQLERVLAQVLPHAERLSASYFETATVLALHRFAEQQVDVEIFEAGVGARFDTCTAMPADIALITPIGLDHQDWLGDSLAEIAEEKAFAMHGCAYAFSVQQDASIRDILQRHHQNVQWVEQQSWPDLAAIGVHQQQNASLAWAAAQTILSEASDAVLAAAKQAINAFSPMARMQLLRHGEQLVYLDAAHNEHAIEALLPTWKRMSAWQAIFVFSRADRCLASCFPKLRPLCKRLIAGQQGDGVDAAYASLEAALEAELKPRGRFLVIGSFQNIAPSMRYVKQQHFP